jgi:hypothetical protein
MRLVIGGVLRIRREVIEHVLKAGAQLGVESEGLADLDRDRE